LHLGDDGFEWRGQHVSLSAAELRLFARLLRARGATLSRWEMGEALGSLEAGASSRALDAHIYRIRRKLRDLPGMQLETVRQRGARLRIGPDAGQ
jgi:DNA-binding response OmpR family regulator